MSTPAPENIVDGSSFGRVTDALGDRVATHRDGQVYARCPVPEHDDHAPSLSVTWRSTDRGGRTLVYCQRGCDTRDVVVALGLTLSDLYDTPPARPTSSDGASPRSHQERKPRSRATSPRPSSSEGGKSSRARREADRPEPIATHVYTDVDATPVFEIRRFVPTEEWPEKYLCATYDQRGARITSRRAPSAARRVLYRLPDVRAAVDAGQRVLLVEGEKDADAAAEADLTATCNPFGSCDIPARAKRNWLAQYTEALRGADVVIVVDNDIAGYRHGQHVATELVSVATSVGITRPALDHKGADLADHLAAGYTVADLVPVEPDELDELAMPDVATVTTEAVRGVAGEDARAGRWLQRWDGTAAAPAAASSAPPVPEVPEAPEQPAERGENYIDLEQQRQRRRGGSGSGSDDGGAGGGGGGPEDDPPPLVVRDRFVRTDAGLFQAKYKNGDEYWVELLSVPVKLTGRYVKDMQDGVPPELAHVDLVAYRDGELHELRNVERQRWESCSWVGELPWPVPYNDTTQGRAALRNAVLATSGDVPLTTQYGVLGWVELEGRWHYLHADGALNSDGPVDTVRMLPPEQLAPYALPTPPQDAEALQEAVQASVGALDLLPERIAAPLLGGAYRACLGRSRTTVMLVGPPAGGKSGLAALMAQHYAPSLRHDRPLVGAGEDAGTVNYLESIRHAAGDMLLPVDDLAPDKGTERASTRCAQIARSQYNGTGKGRQSRTGAVRPSHPPRSLPLVTGEESTTVESAETRIASVRTNRGDIDVDNALPALNEADAPAQRAALIAAMVVHHADQMPLTDWIDEQRATLAADLRDPQAENSGLDARHSESMADLAVGWRAMLDMAVSRGGLSESEAVTLWERAWSGLVECKDMIMSGAARRTPADRVRELLHALLTRQEVSILGRDGGLPQRPDQLGWQRAGAHELEAWRSSTPIGWTDGQHVWLQPGATFAQLSRQATAESEPLTYTKHGLAEVLADAEVIRTAQRRRGGGRRTSVPARVGSSNTPTDVWEFRYDFLFPDDDDFSGGGGGSDGGPDDRAPAAPALTFTSAPKGQPSPNSNSERDRGDPSSEGEAAPESASAVVCDEALDTQKQWQQAPHPQAEEQGSIPVADDGARAARVYHRRRHNELPTFEAVAMVVDEGGVWLPNPGQETCWEPYPGESMSLAGILDWSASKTLGHVDGRGQFARAPQARGQMWLLTDARRAVGLPASLDTKASKNSVRRAFEAAGWTLVDTEPNAWSRVENANGVRRMVVVPEWLATPSALGEDETDVRGLAERISGYADLTGMALVWSPAVTGAQLAAVTRPKILSRGGQRQFPPPAHTPTREAAFDWGRAPAPDEHQMGYAHLWDWNALYLGAARSLPLPWGDYERIQHPGVDLNRPGYWKIAQRQWEHARLPDPFRVHLRDERETMWVTTPTLKVAVELLGWDVAPVEAYLASESVADPWTDDGQMKGYGRLLDKWSQTLSEARTRMRQVDSPDEVLKQAVKDTYSHAVGRFDAQSLRDRERPHPLWRPDWRHMIVAQARYAIMRRVLTAAEAGQYPVAIMTDGLVYTSSSPEPAQALPAGFEAGNKVGQVDHEGCAAMGDVARLLDPESDPVSVTLPDGRVRTIGLAQSLRAGGIEAAIAEVKASAQRS